MLKVYQLISPGVGDAIVTSFADLLKRIELLIQPHGDHLELYYLPNAIPALGEHGLDGSRAHKLRWIANEKSTKIELVEHRPEIAFAELPTAKFKYDFSHDFDPGFEIQSQLYALSMTDETIEDLKAELLTKSAAMLADLRTEFQDDMAVHQRLCYIQRLMGGADFFSDKSHGQRIDDALSELPQQIAEKFEEQARTAYPSSTLTI